jgi:hypothetical protein
MIMMIIWVLDEVFTATAPGWILFSDRLETVDWVSSWKKENESDN